MSTDEEGAPATDSLIDAGSEAPACGAADCATDSLGDGLATGATTGTAMGVAGVTLVAVAETALGVGRICGCAGAGKFGTTDVGDCAAAAAPFVKYCAAGPLDGTEVTLAPLVK
jgi:hypothetical protein